MSDRDKPLVDESLSIEDVMVMGDQAADILNQIREKLLAPYPRKTSPMIASAILADLCGISTPQLRNVKAKHDLPAGRNRGNGRAQEYTLEETIQWVRVAGGRYQRPKESRGRIFAVANFKGGVAKTTTAVTTAQALTLRGRKVLLIDCDPQGSSTQVMGYNPETEIEDEQTLLPLFHRDEQSIAYAIHETYWHNLDLVPASISLSDAEFATIAGLLEDRSFEFWNVLNKALTPIIHDYDVVIIDTPPALGQLTTNSLAAADAMILPCPPEGLDFASSTQFWSLFTDLMKRLPDVGKRYDFVNVLLTKVKARSTDVQRWFSLAYGSRVLPMMIPDSKILSDAADLLKTVYDLDPSKVEFDPDGNPYPRISPQAYSRIRDPFEQFAEYLDSQLVRAWMRAKEV